MPSARCEFCTAHPDREVAVSKWLDDPDERERLTLWLCNKHLARVTKAGVKGYAHNGHFFKAGFW